ncbi:MAG: DUF3037 domain-containing protein [Sphingobacteriales bacterium]|nr:MAG: DUF3037 domain-containing protein [Sphingobacteriales bacterium]
MQDKQLYEYAVIRIVPRVERGEFINAGILLYSKKADYLSGRFIVDREKILALDPLADIALIEAQLQGLERITKGEKSCKSSIATLDKASRFRWLSANRSTIIQTSPIHPGYAEELDTTVERLMQQYVL